MKALLILIVMVLSLDAFSICTSPISRTNINQGQIPTSTKYNADFDVLYGAINNVDGSCLLDSSVQTKQIANSAVTTAKIPDGSITISKFAAGLIPTPGKVLRVKVLTTSGVWSKSPDVEYILIHVVGGGGGTGFTALDGGQSSFGSHCVANGGINCTVASGSPCVSSGYGAPGGTASNGDINFTGGQGGYSDGYGPAKGGYTFFGKFGRGATGTRLSGGAGAGGYCIKLINKTALADNETVTVGAGGQITPVGVPGNAGIVVVYEYGK